MLYYNSWVNHQDSHVSGPVARVKQDCAVLQLPGHPEWQCLLLFQAILCHSDIFPVSNV